MPIETPSGDTAGSTSTMKTELLSADPNNNPSDKKSDDPTNVISTA